MMTKEDLVAEEVQRVLQRLLKNLGMKDYTMKISPGSTHGDNYLGIMAKVQVEGSNEENEDVTLNLMVKSAPQTGFFREIAPIREAYDREIYIYSKVFPIFEKFQKEKNILKPFKSHAKFYSATMEDSNEALIMEDMKEQGYKLSDRHKPLSLDHLMLVMKEYGKLHALSFALCDQKPELFEAIAKDIPETFFSNSNTEIMKESNKLQFQKALNSLDPIKHKVAYEKFKSFQDNMMDLVNDAIQSKPAGDYGVICHGDCWMNNILFKHEENSEVPTDVCLLDWQLSRIGSPALDLSYFLFTCSDKKTRDEHYEQLLKTYHESLSSMLREMGSDPEQLFPFHVLQEHLQKFSVFGLYMAVMVLYAMASEPDEIPEFNKESDIKTLMENFQNETTRNIEEYYDRIRGVILDFVEMDYEF